MIIGQIEQIVSFHSTLARNRSTEWSYRELNEIFLFIGGQAPSRDYLPFPYWKLLLLQISLGLIFCNYGEVTMSYCF